MKILLLCEPRSGSTNFANWFNLDKRFTVLFLPTDPKSKWYRKGNPKNYYYKTEHLLIKEDFYPEIDYSELINFSDKIIFLHRENEADQIASWCNSLCTGNWHSQWIYEKKNSLDEHENFFRGLKEKFKKIRLSSNSGINISYEDLYQKSGINIVIEYLEIHDLNKSVWPVGKKYRIDDFKGRSII